MPDLPYDEYVRPPDDTPLSQAFQDRLTFAQACGLKLPVQLEPGSLVRFAFFNSVPDRLASRIVTHEDVIPAVADLKPILDALPAEFARGSRSVVLTIRQSSSVRPFISTCHFQKIKLFEIVNRNYSRVVDCRALSNYISDDFFPLTSQEVDQFKSKPLNAYIPGFSTRIRWCDLTCLLDESHVWDDLIDACAEVAQARQARLGISSRVWVSSSFLHSALELYQQTPSAYSQNLADIRSLVQSGAVTEFFVVHIADAHASIYRWTRTSNLIGFGDSLGHPPRQRVLDAMNWVLLGLNVPSIIGFTPIEIPRQPDDSGSCVIACCNVVQRALGVTADIWSHEWSFAFRARMIVDLFKYSTLIENFGPVLSSHYNVHPPAPPSEVSDEIENVHVWEEWNLRWPSRGHPALQIADVNVPLAQFRRPSPTMRTAQQQYVDKLMESHRSIMVLLPSVFPEDAAPYGSVLENNNEWDAPPSSRADFKVSSRTLPSTPSSDGVTDSEISPGSVKMEPVDDVVPPSTIYDLRTPPRAPPKHSTSSPMLIDLTTPPPRSQRAPTVKHAASPLSPQQARKRSKACRSPSIIDLITPDTTPLVKFKIESPIRSQVPHSPRRVKTEPSSCLPPIKEEAEASTALPHAPATLPSVSTAPSVGDLFTTLDDAISAVYQYQESCGYKFRRAQVKRIEGSSAKKKQVLRCSSYQQHAPKHKGNIDPADHRHGKSVKTGCMARVNVNLSIETGLWSITTAVFEHNHSRTIPEGASVLRPPTSQERAVVAQFATDHTFSRHHIGEIVQRTLPDSKLDARQLTNVIHKVRRAERDEIAGLGGDFRAVQSALDQLKQEDPRWTYFILVNDDGKVVGLFWQSPEQIRLAQVFGDVVLTDNAANRNQYQFSLNIGIIIDSSRSSRNVWYALHEREDIHSYVWVIDCFLKSTGNGPPGVLFSDRHPSLIAAADLRIPLTDHFFCLDHLNGNVAQHLVPVLGQRWQSFLSAFYRVYWSPSPEEFDRRWEDLLSIFPSARPYLQENLYPIRQHWAWAWLSIVFTAGTRTTGRVEVENRVNKALGGPTVTVKQLFDKLNLRTTAQSAKETMQFRQNSRRHHDTNLEATFRQPLRLLREHSGPFAMQKTYEQMTDSMFYDVKVLRLPHGQRTWTAQATATEKLSAQNAALTEEELKSVDPFKSDALCVSTTYLLEVIASQKLTVSHLFAVSHNSSKTVHTVAIIDPLRHVCDCMMLTSLGVPCRHFFAVWQRVQGMQFHIGLICKRWLNDASLDVSKVAPVAKTHIVHESRLELPGEQLAATLSNPLGTLRATPAPPTTTLGSRTIYHEAQAALQPLMNRVQTQEQLDSLINQLNTIGSVQQAVINPAPPFHDPPIMQGKGRPRTQRLAAAREGLKRGGRTRNGLRFRPQNHVGPIGGHPGDSTPEPSSPELQDEDADGDGVDRPMTGRKCRICRKPGHNARTCPETQAA